MGRKNILQPYKMLDEITLTSTQSSESTNVSGLDSAMIMIDWSGSDAVGTMLVEARMIKPNASEASIDWQTLDFGTIGISGASGNHQIQFNRLDFSELRISFQYTSGTAGTLSAVITGKVTGA